MKYEKYDSTDTDCRPIISAPLFIPPQNLMKFEKYDSTEILQLLKLLIQIITAIVGRTLAFIATER